MTTAEFASRWRRSSRPRDAASKRPPTASRRSAKIEGDGFDVVLTDVVMPNMDGYELFTAIRERWPELPVLMMTAFHYDKDHIIKRSRLEGSRA